MTTLLREDKTTKPDFSYVGEMYDSFARVMKRFELSAEKYDRMNFENCEDPLTYEQSLIRHALQHVNGQEDEDHLAACVANAIILMHLESSK